MLQLAPRFSIEARHHCDERSGFGSWRPLSLHGIFGQQNQTDLAMRSRTSVDRHARIDAPRNVVPGVRSQPATSVGSAPKNCGKPRRRLSFTDLRKRKDCAHMVLCRRASLERNARKSETWLVVPEV